MSKHNKTAIEKGRKLNKRGGKNVMKNYSS